MSGSRKWSEIKRERALPKIEFAVTIDMRSGVDITDEQAEDLLDVLLEHHAGAVTRESGLVGSTFTINGRTHADATDNAILVMTAALTATGIAGYRVASVEVMTVDEQARQIG